MAEMERDRDERTRSFDWERRITELYAAARAESDPERAWRLWRDSRTKLFSAHPQSPLVRSHHPMPRYFDRDPNVRVVGTVVPVIPHDMELPGSGPKSYPAQLLGTVAFDLAGYPCRLDAYRLTGDAGGLFLPFRDASSGGETYEGGRYLLDAARGADLGGGADALILDFNFAYQPTCAYDPQSSSPLAPPSNLLPLSVRAGERM